MNKIILFSTMDTLGFIIKLQTANKDNNNFFLIDYFNKSLLITMAIISPNSNFLLFRESLCQV